MSTIASPRQPPPQPHGSSHAQTPSSPVTSSARSSLSLDRNTTSATNPRRNRTALRDYYKLPNSASPPPSPSSTSATTSTTTSSHHQLDPSTHQTTTHTLLTPLDAPSFIPQPYVSNLLKTSSLESVLRVESALIGEIRGADGERKALVYDNYSKLIAATETIRRMRERMEGEEDEVGAGGGYFGKAKTGVTMWGAGGSGLGMGMGGGAGAEVEGGSEGVNVRARVGPMIDGIAALAASVAAVDADAAVAEGVDVSATTSPRDHATPAANNTSGSAPPATAPTMAQQKATVRYVLATPERLEALLARGRREEAEAEWVRVKRVLERWKGVGGVEELQKRAEEVMAVAAEKQNADEKVEENGNRNGNGDGHKDSELHEEEE